MQHSRFHLETLKVPDLKALCKESKITGYSKLKRSELIEKIFQATSEPGAAGPPLQNAPSGGIAHSSADQLATRPHQTPGQSFSVSNTPLLNDDTPSTVQSTLLGTPSETCLPKLDSSFDLAVDTEPFAGDASTSSSAVCGNNLDLLSMHFDRSAPTAPANHAYNMPSSSTLISGQRNVTATDAAVSLKDAVAMQREKKRKAGESLSAKITSQKGKKAARLVDPNSNKAVSHASPLTLGNALQLANMTPVALEDTAWMPNGTIREVVGFSFSTRSLQTLAAFESPLQTSTLHTASSSTSLDSHPSATSKVVTNVTLPPNYRNMVSSDLGGLTTGYNLAIPAAYSNSSVTSSMSGDSTSTSKPIAKHSGSGNGGRKIGEANAETSAIMQNPGKKTTTTAIKPVRRGNPKMVRLKQSIIPVKGDAVIQSSTAAPTPSCSLPRGPLGTAPLSTSEHIKIGYHKNKDSVKMGNISNFAAPTPNSRPSSSILTRSLLPSLSEEEPLLFRPGDASTSDTLSNARSTARIELTVRMTKSWLSRFYHQLENARSDAMNRASNISSGSRAPAGLPGMSADFVCSATSTAEQFNVAVTFVIARIHTLIQGDDWIGLVKEEDIEEVTEIGGGVWEVSTRLQVIDDAARSIGGSRTMKTRKCIYTVIGETGEVLERSEASDSALRADWRSYIAAVRNDDTIALLDYLKTKDNTSYPHGIATGWSAKAKIDEKLEKEYHMAERYVLSNVMPNSCSGEYRSSLQMDAMWIGQGTTSVQPRRPKVNLYLPESHQVESVSFIARGPTADRPLHPSVAIVKRKTAEDFVLRETGQVIGNVEESGVVMVWQCLLGCEASGVALPTAKAKEITTQFWTGLNDDM